MTHVFKDLPIKQECKTYLEKGSRKKESSFLRDIHQSKQEKQITNRQAKGTGLFYLTHWIWPRQRLWIWAVKVTIGALGVVATSPLGI